MAIDEKVLIERLEKCLDLSKHILSDRVDYYVGSADAYEHTIKIVNQLSKEHNNGWIPCSERLPKENESVLLQDYECHMTIERCKTKYGIIGFEDDYGWASANCSLAWLPLPAPYKGEQK